MIRKATFKDVQDILNMIEPLVEQEILLAKTGHEIMERIRDYFVFEDSGIRGCAALYPGWEELAEIRTLAVASDSRGQGIGKALVRACIEDAKEIGIQKVFALTYEKGFFESLGFKQVPKKSLPQKIFKDCIKCPHFPNCNEIAMVLE